MKHWVYLFMLGILMLFGVVFAYAISLNPSLIKQDKVKTFMAEKLFYTNPELTSNNFTVNKIIQDNNLTIIKIQQDKKQKTLIISNKKALEKLT